MTAHKWRNKQDIIIVSNGNIAELPAIEFVSFYSKTNEMHQFLKSILFWSSTLHVSDGLSVHQQESKTVHTASGMCHTGSGTAQSVAAPVWHIPDAVCTVLDSW